MLELLLEYLYLLLSMAMLLSFIYYSLLSVFIWQEFLCMSLPWCASALIVLCTGEFLVAETEAPVSQSVKIPSVMKTNYFYCITYLQFLNKLNYHLWILLKPTYTPVL